MIIPIALFFGFPILVSIASIKYFWLPLAGVGLNFGYLFYLNRVRRVDLVNYIYNKTSDAMITFPQSLIFFLATGSLFVVRMMTKHLQAKSEAVMTVKGFAHVAEASEDWFLTEQQKLEEKLGSKEYNVYVDMKPGSFEKVVVGKDLPFSVFKDCTVCKTKTAELKNTVTLIDSTYSYSGEGRRNFECLSCHHNYSETFVIPKKSSSNDGSSGGGGAGGSW